MSIDDFALSFCPRASSRFGRFAGCGRATYLERLDETRRYFDYEDRLNQSLTTVAWAGKSFQLRVPKQFRPITAKANSSEDRDPRQPTFADLELPGLQGAWEASFPLTGGENKKIPGWLYLCSNFDLLAKKSDEGKAAGFNGDLLHTVAKAWARNSRCPGWKNCGPTRCLPGARRRLSRSGNIRS